MATTTDKHSWDRDLFAAFSHSSEPIYGDDTNNYRGAGREGSCRQIIPDIRVIRAWERLATFDDIPFFILDDPEDDSLLNFAS